MTLPTLNLIRDDELKRVPDNFQRIREWAKKVDAEIAAGGGGGGSSGAAGGDLAGTYPDPTVTQARGLRETAGPTTLAMGAVADGQLLQRSGTTVIGVASSGSSVPTGTGFRHVTAGVEDAASKLVDTADINADQVTYAKLQNVSAASKLLGRGASGAGDPEEITLGTGLSMSGTTLNSPGGVVPTGTGFTHITAGAQDAAAKLVDTADVNDDQVTYAKMQNVSAASKLLGRGDSGSGDPQEIGLGTGLAIAGTTLTAVAGAQSAKYASGSFTIPTGQFAIYSRHIELKGSERLTLEGTATFRIT